MGAPADRLFQMINGYRMTRLLAAAVEMNLAGLLSEGPRPATDLAVATGTLPGPLRRFLRGLAAYGVVQDMGDGRFGATELTPLLARTGPGTVGSFALSSAHEGYLVWAELMDVLKTGEPAYERVHGKPRFQDLATKPDHAQAFNAMMAGLTAPMSAALLNAVDLSAARLVVDVGGGTGQLLADILTAHPAARGILFDIPSGLEAAATAMASRGLSDRVRLVEGDFFDAVPEGADLYLLKWIVHDWADAEAVRILKTCRRAMSPQSRLLIVERRFPDRAVEEIAAQRALIGDLQMMVVLGGKERTPAEYAALLRAADLKVVRDLVVNADFMAVEAAPA